MKNLVLMLLALGMVQQMVAGNLTHDEIRDGYEARMDRMREAEERANSARMGKPAPVQTETMHPGYSYFSGPEELSPSERKKMLDGYRSRRQGLVRKKSPVVTSAPATQSAEESNGYSSF